MQAHPVQRAMPPAYHLLKVNLSQIDAENESCSASCVIPRMHVHKRCSHVGVCVCVRLRVVVVVV